MDHNYYRKCSYIKCIFNKAQGKDTLCTPCSLMYMLLN
jgi:hypothetical protein